MALVLIRGKLRGMGREVDCELIARGKGPDEQDKALYSDCSVIDAPPDLPDGEYTVSVGNQLFTAAKRRGLWVSCRETSEP